MLRPTIVHQEGTAVARASGCHRVARVSALVGRRAVPQNAGAPSLQRSGGSVLAVSNAESRAPSERGVLASLSLIMLLSSLNTSVANIALPTIAEVFAASFQAVQWVVLSYLLAITTLIVSVGRLGDVTGRRSLLLAGVSLFTVGSVVCGVAPALWLLVLGRAVQGLGAAMMLALTMAFVGETVPRSRVGRAMGLLATMSASGTALGPSLGGFLISEFGWRAVFLINVPMGVLSFFLARRYLPGDHGPARTHATRFDYIGTLLLAATLGSFALALTVGRGRFGSLNLALLVMAGLGVVLFVTVEARTAAPLIPLKLLRDGLLRASLAMNALVSTVMMATLVVGPFYLARSLGLDPAQVGLVMSVGPLVAALTGVPAGRAVDRFGAHAMTILGLSGIAAGALALAVLPETVRVFGYIAPMVVITAGYGLFHAANNTAVMKDAGEAERGVVSGLLNLSRNLGLVTGASVMGAVFTLASGTTAIITARPETVAVGLRVTFAVAVILVMIAVALALGRRERAEPMSHRQTQRRHGRAADENDDRTV